MKRILSLVLVLSFVLSLAACNNKDTLSNISKKPTATQSKIESTDSTTTNTELITSTESTPSGTLVQNSSTAESPSVNSNASSTSSIITEYSKTTETSKPTTGTPAASSNPTVLSNPADSSEPVHTHSFKAATCTAAKTCPCGVTEGAALGHNWNAATCTTAKTCSVCKVAEGNALGHKWNEATCKVPKTCSVCKVTEGNTSEHKYDKFVCTLCGFKDEERIAIATNPKLSFKPKKYTTEYSEKYLDGNILSVHTLEFGETIYFADQDYDRNPSHHDPNVNKDSYIIYNGEKYYSTTGQGGRCEDWHYELTDKYVIVYEYSTQILKCTLNLDGTLTVIESKYPRFIIGTVLK